MHKRLSIAFALTTIGLMEAHAQTSHKVELLCHRTANKDVPENTLESLEQAALLGCGEVEIDLRRTLDGKIILNHDGFLERLTDGTGEVETTFYEDLRMRDAGSWMGARFANMHIVLFEDALRLAREKNIHLVLDIKTKGIGVEVLRILDQEQMRQHVVFNGEWDDVKKLYPAATDAGAGRAWVQPGVSTEQVNDYHRQGKAVIANFSANDYQMDLFAMKNAVAAGVDGLNVDFPRLGADAVGRPVEETLRALEQRAENGTSESRTQAVFELARYSEFPLGLVFTRLLMDKDGAVSRAAALALVQARPRTKPTVFAEALKSSHPQVRANAAWALGALRASSSSLLLLLKDNDPAVLQETLTALAHMPGNVPRELLEPLLKNSNSIVRAGATVAMARHQPQAAETEVPNELAQEIARERAIFATHEKSGGGKFSQPEIDQIVALYRSQMEMLRALNMLSGPAATQSLETQAFGPTESYLQPNADVAAADLWDRAGAEAAGVVHSLASADVAQADRAEWILIHSGADVLPQVRSELRNKNPGIRRRAMQVVAWQGDVASLADLRAIKAESGPDADVAAWAITKIESLQPML
jgi:glycerophosphoryl diester phosphodiesterase